MAKTKQIDRSDINNFNAWKITQDAVFSKLNCHALGKIIEFDPATQLCTVELMQVKQFQNQYYTPAPITQVPLLIYGAKNGHITLPDPVGTICLVIFSDRNIDNFIETGEQYESSSTRMHDLTDAICFTTFKTLANSLSDYDTRAVHIFNEETIEDIIYHSLIKVYGDHIQLNSASGEDSTNIIINPVSYTQTTTTSTIDTTTLNTLSDNTTIQASNKINLTSDLGGNIDVAALINVSNTAQSLAPLMQALITAIINIIIVDSQLSQASKNTLNAIKAQFAELLI